MAQKPMAVLDGPPGLYAILDLLKMYHLSMWDFLKAFFTSISTRHQASYFFRNSGHVKLFTLWCKELGSCKHIYPLVDAALDLVSSHMELELRRLSGIKALKRSSQEITQSDIDDFSMNAITAIFRMQSPYLVRLLERLTSHQPALLPTRNARPVPDPDKDEDEYFDALDSSVLVPTIGSMLLYNSNRGCNLLQAVAGVFLFGCGCQAKVVQFLTKARLSVSPSTISRSLERLSNVAITFAQRAALKGPIILVWDNINLSFRAYDQRVTSDHSVQSGTNATMIEGLEIGPISDLKDVYNRLSMEDLTPNSNDTHHLDKIMRFHLINILKRRVDKFRGCINTVPEVGPLPVMQSKTYPLRTMRIDQSSVEGNKAVIEDIIKSLQLPEAYFGELKRIILAGDQLTVCRVRSIIKQLRREKTAYARMEWALPTIQLFHLQMSFVFSIFRTHYGSPGVGGSLANAILLLGRIRVNKDKPNFHAVDELIRHVLDATALKAWEGVFDTKDLSTIADDLDESVVERLIQKKADDILFAILSRSQHEERDGIVFKEEESPVKTTASMNSSLFLRDAIVYVELGASIKAGDIGRIEAILRWITVMFQAGSTKNYANELLHLFCGLKYAWPDQAKHAILSSMLVNTTGKPNRWLATDMHQEHNNLLIKVIHAAKGGNLSWETLAEKIAAIIETFARTKKKFEVEFGLKHNNIRHSTVDSADEIKILMGALHDHDIFNVHLSRPDPKKAEPVVDLMEQGMINLQSRSRLDIFSRAFGKWIRKRSRLDGLQEDIEDVEEGIDMDYEDFNPEDDAEMAMASYESDYEFEDEVDMDYDAEEVYEWEL